jgi:hypothetical protein
MYLPRRIMYGFCLQKVLSVAGTTGGGNFKQQSFHIADKIGHPDRWEHFHSGGSGFCEWLKVVPGIQVISSVPYKGAHGGWCRSYTITFTDGKAVDKYQRKSLEMWKKAYATFCKAVLAQRAIHRPAARELQHDFHTW